MRYLNILIFVWKEVLKWFFKFELRTLGPKKEREYLKLATITSHGSTVLVILLQRRKCFASRWSRWILKLVITFHTEALYYWIYKMNTELVNCVYNLEITGNCWPLKIFKWPNTLHTYIQNKMRRKHVFCSSI